MKKIAIITGASRGIGVGIAQNLIKNYKIYNLSKSGAIPEIFNKNNDFLSYKLDITNLEDTNKVIEKIINDEKKIDVLIHNSGITNDKFFHKMNYSEWFSVLNTNLLSCYNICYPIINNMRSNNKGDIIFMSSVNAHKGCIGQTNYCSSKAGIIGFAKSLALENAVKNIKVNVISPGYIETDMTKKIDEKILNNIKSSIPINKLGSIDDIGHTVEYILNNKYITGANIDVNGGLYLR